MRESYKERIDPGVLNKLRLLVVLAVFFPGLALRPLIVGTQEWRWAPVGLGGGVGIRAALPVFGD